jgi:cation diffusion facilitator CzcD-associated flavoprotein CzcO
LPGAERRPRDAPTPRYGPWRQRIAFIPDGSLFQAIRGGEAPVVTDAVEGFDEAGLRLKSGRHLAADDDVVVAATGFHLCVVVDVAFAVDGRPLAFADAVT